MQIFFFFSPSVCLLENLTNVGTCHEAMNLYLIISGILRCSQEWTVINHLGINDTGYPFTFCHDSIHLYELSLSY